jgi:hypothetical protein
MVKSKVKKSKSIKKFKVSKSKSKKRRSNAVDSVIKILPAIIITAGAIGLVSGLLNNKKTTTQSVS